VFDREEVERKEGRKRQSLGFVKSLIKFVKRWEEEGKGQSGPGGTWTKA